MIEIFHILKIRTDPPTVYRAITEEKGIAEWWTDKVKAKPKENTIAEFSFGEKYHNKMRITKLKENQIVEWLVVEDHEDWVNTKISFKLQKEGDHTVLRFIHSNWREKNDFYAHCNYNWAWYLNSLRLYCETGEGKPYQTRADLI
jgi:uncharacterized protein YndB with AHSA1/START domain